MCWQSMQIYTKVMTMLEAVQKGECLCADVQTLQQRANWLACKTTGSTDKVLMTLPEGDAVSVLPLWIAVHQSLEGGLARCAQGCYSARSQRVLHPVSATSSKRRINTSPICVLSFIWGYLSKRSADQGQP